jgi:hypothetical protein
MNEFLSNPDGNLFPKDYGRQPGGTHASGAPSVRASADGWDDDVDPNAALQLGQMTQSRKLDFHPSKNHRNPLPETRLKQSIRNPKPT